MLLIFFILASIAIGQKGQAAPKTQTNKAAKSDDKVGSNAEDFSYLSSGGKMPPPSSSTAALTEAEKRKKDNLTTKYPSHSISVKIDSIHPTGGPITGETRVLVRGGPFEDMHLIYPSPKCKFGKHSMIVPATYVSCTTKPLHVDEVEGKKANRNDHCL